MSGDEGAVAAEPAGAPASIIPDGLIRRFLRDEDGVKYDRPSPSYDQNDFVHIELEI